MGMYLGLYRIKDKKEQHPNTEMLDLGFDKSTSAEYATAGFDREWIGCDTPYCCVTLYWRPLEFNKEKEWIKRNLNLGEDGRDTLLKAISLAEKDSELWFEYS